MKSSLVIVVLLALMTAAAVSAEQYLPVDPQKFLNEPGFIGYVPNEVIVVLKPGVTIDHRKDMASNVALSDLDGFRELSEQFGVQRLRPQFPGSDRGVQAATESKQALSRHYKVYFETGELDEVVAAYEANPLVERVERVGIHTFRATPNDPYYDNPPAEYPYDQWHYWDTYGVAADQAWDVTPGDATVVVGVLDSGVKYDHGDLGGSNPPGPNDTSTNGNIWINSQEIAGNGVDDDGNGYIDDVIGWDFVDRSDWYIYSCTETDCGTADNDPFDGNGHGTHVAGTIAGITNNGYAVAGVAGGYGDGGFTTSQPNGVKVVPCRIGYTVRYRGQELGVVIMDYAAEAMYYMAELKIRGENVAAINCSWGSSNDGGLGAATDYLLAQDVMVIVAAGNSNSSAPDYLGGRTDCLDVGATDQSGNPASFSDYGSWVDIAAPGVGILSTTTDPADPTVDYISVFDGTSMAAPHVVGVAALLESCDPTLSAQDKWNLMVGNTTPYNQTKDVGSGIVNASLAFAAAGCTGQCNETTPVADFSGSPTSGEAPLTVSFTDLSTNNPASWSWDFGDGGTSTAQNPSYEYTAAGTYTVTLTASNCAGSDIESKVDYITVSEPVCNETTPVADFSGSPTSGDAPLTVSFTDLSTNNPDTWSWDFGDGGTSTAQNPSYEYAAAGTYTVTLTASNCAGSDIATKTDYITVTQPQGASMHVHDLVVTRKTAGPNCSGIGTITIYDSAEQPVANATVYATATGPVGGTFSGLTAADGTVAFETGKTRSCSGEWCFEVTNVTHASNTYDAAANHVTQACESGWVYGEHDGTMAQVVPEGYGLDQNYPNPFNPATEIAFSLPNAGHVTVEVFNVAGQRVATLAEGQYEAGRHVVTWDASNVSSGIYLYRLISGDLTQTKKMVLLK